MNTEQFSMTTCHCEINTVLPSLLSEQSEALGSTELKFQSLPTLLCSIFGVLGLLQICTQVPEGRI